MSQSRRSRRRKDLLKKVRNDICYLGVRLVTAFAPRVPLEWGLRIGAAIGGLAFGLARPARRKVLAHLRVAFPEKDESWRTDVGRRSFANLGRSFFELFHFDEILAGVEGRGKYVGYLRVKGQERLVRQAALDRGVIFITGHCGNWELVAAYVARMGYKVNTIVRDLFDPRIDRLLTERRDRHGYHPIPRDGAHATRETLMVLRRKEVLAFLMDQDAKVRGVFVPFFGHLAYTPSGPAVIARRARMEVLPGFLHRRPEGGHEFVIGHPVPWPQTGDKETDIIEYTAALTKTIEENIRRHPDEWVWMHRRWKRRPEGEPPEARPVKEYV